MGKSKGQVSMEYTVVMAAMLIILIVLVVIFNGIYAQEALHEQYAQSNHVVSILSAGARDVWAQGPGAHQEYMLDIPVSVILENSSIANHTLSLHVRNFGDAFAVLPFNVSGSWPNQTGTFRASIHHNGTHVLIRPAGMVSISRTGFYFNSSSQSYGLTIQNRANVSYTITQTLECSICSYDEEGTTSLGSGESVTGNLTISGYPPGIRTGHFNITAIPAPDSDLPNETFTLPITIVNN
ncbi:MAG: hypothetical protein ABIH83_01360 [Candidatus Micrarchaeota archaeon]